MSAAFDKVERAFRDVLEAREKNGGIAGDEAGLEGEARQIICSAQPWLRWGLGGTRGRLCLIRSNISRRWRFPWHRKKGTRPGGWTLLPQAV